MAARLRLAAALLGAAAAGAADPHPTRLPTHSPAEAAAGGAGDWVVTANYSRNETLRVGFDVDASCAGKPLTSCPLAAYWQLEAGGDPPGCWRVGADGAQPVEIVPGQFTRLPPQPWAVRLLRRGSYFFLRVNGVQVAFVRSPRMEVLSPCPPSLPPPTRSWRWGQIHCDGNNGGARPAHFEPLASGARLETASGLSLPLHSRPVSWGTALDRPVLSHGHAPWSASQAIPGAVLRVNGTTYLYFVSAAQNMPHQEAGGNALGGVAHCPTGSEADPSAWTMLPEPVLRNKTGTFASVSVYVNGAVVAPDGRYCLSFFGEPNMSISFAYSSSPLGPFAIEGPELKPTMPWASAAQHEHDLVRLDNGTYLLFYTAFGGFDVSIDQGGIATSEE